MAHLVIWEGLDDWRAEVAHVAIGDGELSATGTQLGVDPLPYRLDYELETSEGFVTRAMRVEVGGEGWARRLDLSHDGHGNWRCESEQDGMPDLPAPGGGVSALGDARDVDLGLSPLTNLMPLRRAACTRAPARPTWSRPGSRCPISGCTPRASATSTFTEDRVAPWSVTWTSARTPASRATSKSTETPSSVLYPGGSPRERAALTASVDRQRELGPGLPALVIERGDPTPSSRTGRDGAYSRRRSRATLPTRSGSLTASGRVAPAWRS